MDDARIKESDIISLIVIAHNHNCLLASVLSRLFVGLSDPINLGKYNVAGSFVFSISFLLES